MVLVPHLLAPMPEEDLFKARRYTGLVKEGHFAIDDRVVVGEGMAGGERVRFGGAEAVTFASMFPTEVRGLLLLDASPPAWNTAICAVPDDGSSHVGTRRASSTPSVTPTSVSPPTRSSR